MPVFVTQMFHNMKFQWAGFLLEMVSAPIPYIFFMYGERVRRRSKKASKAVKGSGEGREKEGEVRCARFWP